MPDAKSESMRSEGWFARLRHLLLSRFAVRVYWVLNAALLLGTLGWIFYDGKFYEAALQFTRHVRAFWNDESALAVVTPLMWPRVDAIWAIVVAGLASAVGIAAGLVAGASQHRNTRAWLAVMFLVAGWLTLFTTWPEITWRGQAWRVRGAVSEFEKLSQTLLADWPETDGKLDGLGPFMAYPIGNPRTLMFMTVPRMQNSRFSIATIERGDDDDLHFQLGGNDEGPWLLRHSGVDEPQPFFSGLEGEYIPIKHARVAEGWFLVRYMYAPIVPSDTPRIGVPRR